MSDNKPETPANVPVETPEVKKRTHSTPVGKTTILELAKNGYVYAPDGEYYIRVEKNDESGNFVEVPVSDLIGLNDSITLAVTRVLNPDKVGVSQAQAAIKKALASGVSIEDLISSL